MTDCDMAAGSAEKWSKRAKLLRDVYEALCCFCAASARQSNMRFAADCRIISSQFDIGEQLETRNAIPRLRLHAA